MKIALYARVSTDDKGQDPLNQLLQLREFATKQGWTITEEYVDEISGGKGEASRPRFKQLWLDAARHKFDCLLFWSLDRFTREGTYKTLQYLRRLSDQGIKFKSHTEPYIDSMGVFGEAIIGVIAAVNQQQRIRISESVKAGILRAKAQGKSWKRGPSKKPVTSRSTLWRRSKVTAC